MTRKDYQLLADVLRDARHGYTDAIDDFTLELADRLAQDNKAFDKDKFINDIRG